MAKKAESFKVNTTKKTITLYTNVEQTTAEKTLIEIYLNQGFIPMFEEKKKGKTVEEMRKELKGTDKLAEFEKAYQEEKGFFKACKIYNTWKKDQNTKKSWFKKASINYG